MSKLFNKNWDEIIEMDVPVFGSQPTDIAEKPEVQECENVDFEEPLAGEGLIQIPRGKYLTQVIGWGYKHYPQYSSANSKDKGRRIRLEHVILEGDYKGLHLQQYFTRYDEFSNATEYYQAYVLLHKGKLPNKKDRMPAKAFLGVICEVWVDLTKKKTKSGSFKQECLQHSIVKEILLIQGKEEIKYDYRS